MYGVLWFVARDNIHDMMATCTYKVWSWLCLRQESSNSIFNGYICRSFHDLESALAWTHVHLGFPVLGFLAINVRCCSYLDMVSLGVSSGNFLATGVRFYSCLDSFSPGFSNALFLCHKSTDFSQSILTFTRAFKCSCSSHKYTICILSCTQFQLGFLILAFVPWVLDYALTWTQFHLDFQMLSFGPYMHGFALSWTIFHLGFPALFYGPCLLNSALNIMHSF